MQNITKGRKAMTEKKLLNKMQVGRNGIKKQSLKEKPNKTHYFYIFQNEISIIKKGSIM